MHWNKFGNCVDVRVAKRDILEVLMASLASDDFFNIITQIQFFSFGEALNLCYPNAPFIFLMCFMALLTCFSTSQSLEEKKKHPSTCFLMCFSTPKCHLS